MLPQCAPRRAIQGVRGMYRAPSRRGLWGRRATLSAARHASCRCHSPRALDCVAVRHNAGYRLCCSLRRLAQNHPRKRHHALDSVTRGSVGLSVSSTVMVSRRTAHHAADTGVAAAAQRRVHLWADTLLLLAAPWSRPLAAYPPAIHVTVSETLRVVDNHPRGGSQMGTQ